MDYYNIHHLAERWKSNPELIQHYIETGKLACHTWIKPTWMFQGEFIHQANGEEVFKQEARIWKKGLIGMLSEECRWIFRYGRAQVSTFCNSLKEGRYFQVADVNSNLLIENADIIILNCDISLFEQKHCISESQKSKGLESNFTHSKDYQTVHINGINFRFGFVQSQIIQQLHEASQTDQVWVHGKQLLHLSGSRSEQLRNVFQGKKFWRQCIESDSRGYYRLRLI